MTTMDRAATPTTLQQIRDFLRRENAAPPPWTRPEGSVEALYDLLRLRRDDERFWASLKDLASRLEDRRFDAARLGACEVLGHATLDRLLDDLRASLDAPGKPRLPDWLRSGVSAAALMAFLVLGTATACAPADPAGTEDGTCGEAIANSIPAGEAGTYCELVEIIKAAAITAETKQILLDCLPDLDAAYREELLDQFVNSTDEQIASILDAMTSLHGTCDDGSSDVDADAH
jgi:hypothetical protein